MAKAKKDVVGKKKASKYPPVMVLMAKDFADIKRISNQGVCRALRKAELDQVITSKTLTGVQSFVRIGRYYQLTVDTKAAGFK